MGLFNPRRTAVMVSPADALPGRAEPVEIPHRHLVLGTPLAPPFPEGMAQAMFAMGCFWGAERIFWSQEGVYTTAVGYAGGVTPNPTYEEVCSGRTGHAETVLCVFDPARTSYVNLVRLFLEGHDPTQGMRQGNDVGTQYRSAVFATSDEQLLEATNAAQSYGEALAASGHGAMTTELVRAGPFYYAEAYHQQYLAANPNGYCGLGSTGVACPIGVQAGPGSAGPGSAGPGSGGAGTS